MEVKMEEVDEGGGAADEKAPTEMEHKVEKTPYDLLKQSKGSAEEIDTKLLSLKKEGKPKFLRARHPDGFQLCLSSTYPTGCRRRRTVVGDRGGCWSTTRDDVARRRGTLLGNATGGRFRSGLTTFVATWLLNCTNFLQFEVIKGFWISI